MPDVSDALLQLDRTYGGMGSTKPQSLSVNRRLDFARGNTIQNPALEFVNIAPVSLTFEDSVGLFGAENTFVKVQLNVVAKEITSSSLLDSDLYLSVAFLRNRVEGDLPDYSAAFISHGADVGIVNDYESAENNTELPVLVDPVVSVSMNNIGTGNIYIDQYLDVTFYDADRRAIDGDKLYVGANNFFYVGFHARKPKRLPYKVALEIGIEFESGLLQTAAQKEYRI